MAFIITFIVLCIVEAIVIYMKVDELQDFHKVGTIASSVLNIKEQYVGLIDRIATFFIKNSWLKWVAIALILVANVLIAAVIHMTWSIISFFFIS